MIVRPWNWSDAIKSCELKVYKNGECSGDAAGAEAEGEGEWVPGLQDAAGGHAGAQLSGRRLRQPHLQSLRGVQDQK